MSRKWGWLGVLLLVAIVGAVAVIVPRQPDKQQAASPSLPNKPVGVGARAQIEPEDGVTFVAAPYFNGRPSLISELRVKEGDWVQAGQIIAILDGWGSLETTLRQSEASVEVARTKLAQVQAGSKQSDIDAQKMEISRWESEYEASVSDYRRFEQLRENEIAPPSVLEEKHLVVDRNKRTLDAAKERLKSLELVRKEDVNVQSAALAEAAAQVEHAKVDVERMVVRAPESGRVLRIHTRLGEEVGSQGILEMGKTNRMYAVAEVYESDISRVHIGQKATISSELLADGLSGTVIQISFQVTKSELLPTDPAAFADTRVIRVKIQLDNPERVTGLIHGKVDVVIHQ